MAAGPISPRPAAAWGLCHKRLRRASLRTRLLTPDRRTLRARAAQGEIKEGSESEVRAAVFVVALTREVDAASGSLCWKAAEISYNAGTLFL